MVCFKSRGYVVGLWEIGKGRLLAMVGGGKWVGTMGKDGGVSWAI